MFSNYLADIFLISLDLNLQALLCEDVFLIKATGAMKVKELKAAIAKERKNKPEPPKHCNLGSWFGPASFVDFEDLV